MMKKILTTNVGHIVPRCYVVPLCRVVTMQSSANLLITSVKSKIDGWDDGENDELDD